MVLAPPLWKMLPTKNITDPAGIVAWTVSVLSSGTCVDPLVAARDDASGAVRLGEIVECPHAVDDELLVGTFDGEALVAVETLSGFTRSNVDADRGGEDELLAEEILKGSLEERVEGGIIERSGLGEERVDALGAETLEVVPAGGYRGEDALEVSLLARNVLGAAVVLDDGVAVLDAGHR